VPPKRGELSTEHVDDVLTSPACRRRAALPHCLEERDVRVSRPRGGLQLDSPVILPLPVQLAAPLLVRPPRRVARAPPGTLRSIAIAGLL